MQRDATCSRLNVFVEEDVHALVTVSRLSQLRTTVFDRQLFPRSYKYQLLLLIVLFLVFFKRLCDCYVPASCRVISWARNFRKDGYPRSATTLSWVAWIASWTVVIIVVIGLLFVGAIIFCCTFTKKWLDRGLLFLWHWRDTRFAAKALKRLAVFYWRVPSFQIRIRQLVKAVSIENDLDIMSCLLDLKLHGGEASNRKCLQKDSIQCLVSSAANRSRRSIVQCMAMECLALVAEYVPSSTDAIIRTMMHAARPEHPCWRAALRALSDLAYKGPVMVDKLRKAGAVKLFATYVLRSRRKVDGVLWVGSNTLHVAGPALSCICEEGLTLEEMQFALPALHKLMRQGERSGLMAACEALKDLTSEHIPSDIINTVSRSDACRELVPVLRTSLRWWRDGDEDWLRISELALSVVWNISMEEGYMARPLVEKGLLRVVASAVESKDASVRRHAFDVVCGLTLDAHEDAVRAVTLSPIFRNMARVVEEREKDPTVSLKLLRSLARSVFHAVLNGTHEDADIIRSDLSPDTLDSLFADPPHDLFSYLEEATFTVFPELCIGEEVRTMWMMLASVVNRGTCQLEGVNALASLPPRRQIPRDCPCPVCVCLRHRPKPEIAQNHSTILTPPRPANNVPFDSLECEGLPSSPLDTCPMLPMLPDDDENWSKNGHSVAARGQGLRRTASSSSSEEEECCILEHCHFSECTEAGRAIRLDQEWTDVICDKACRLAFHKDCWRTYTRAAGLTRAGAVGTPCGSPRGCGGRVISVNNLSGPRPPSSASAGRPQQDTAAPDPKTRAQQNRKGSADMTSESTAQGKLSASRKRERKKTSGSSNNPSVSAPAPVVSAAATASRSITVSSNITSVPTVSSLSTKPCQGRLLSEELDCAADAPYPEAFICRSSTPPIFLPDDTDSESGNSILDFDEYNEDPYTSTSHQSNSTSTSSASDPHLLGKDRSKQADPGLVPPKVTSLPNAPRPASGQLPSAQCDHVPSPDPPHPQLSCQLCDVTLTSERHYQKHIAGRRHIEKQSAGRTARPPRHRRPGRESNAWTSPFATVSNPLGKSIGRGSRKSSEELDGEDECVVCFERKVGVKLQPCGHAILCTICVRTISHRLDACPFCRQPISCWTNLP